MSIIQAEIANIEQTITNAQKELAMLRTYSKELTELDEILPTELIYHKSLFAYSDYFSLLISVKDMPEETILQEIFRPIRDFLQEIRATPEAAIERSLEQQTIVYQQAWQLTTKHKIIITVSSYDSPDCNLIEETVVEKRWRLECSQPIEE